MTEKQLISQLKKLKEVKPSQDWVVLTKERIFKEEKQEKNVISIFATFIGELQRGEKFLFQHKLAFSSALLMVVFVGLFGFAQNSVPGNSLFTIKKITERGQAVFIVDKTRHDFEIAERRLDDLTKIARDNDVNNLAPALVEYDETVSRVAEGLARTENVEEIVAEIKKLEEKEEEVRSLGIEIAENEDLDNVLAAIVEREVESLGEGGVDTAEIEELYNKKEYSKALEGILMLQK